ncbi:amylo-alpha-1,6-glucosidase [Lederbergia citrea]|nr:GH116 family glycosyl hydrolase [Lederbergia citrea]MBS4204010.1 glycogen debranching protein [Lederbergia citrea]
MNIKEDLKPLAVENFQESKKIINTNIQDLYICAGDRAHVIGAQSGLFPDFGHHVKDEMGGVWSHPIKLLDGYWLGFSQEDGNNGVNWLKEANEFHNYPYYNEHDYELANNDLQVIRRQFCPDGLQGVVVTYFITNTSDVNRKLDVSFLGRTDLSPVWFSENLGIKDGLDVGRLDESAGIFIGNDSENPWYVVFGADRPFQKGKQDRHLFGPEETAGQGISGLLTYEDVEIQKGDTIELNFFIAGSNISEESALQTFATIKNQHNRLFEAKKERYEKILNKTMIKIPDKHLEKVFNWNKFHMDWLTMEVPEVGRGLVAGHPEYPWWFGCDNSYALLGNLPIGNLELAIETLDLVHNVSENENGNGRIIHEVSTCGAVANKGNTQETPHFIMCVWETFLWTGDYEFLKRMYPTVKKGIDWIFNEMDPDGDLLPEGYGIIEIEGLNVELIDTAVYSYGALNVGSLMADMFEESSLAEHYRGLANKLKETINQEMWMNEEKLYADAMATPKLILSKIDLYIDRAKNDHAINAVKDLEQMKEKILNINDQEKQLPWLFKNWVINTPMELGLAPREQAIPALNRMGTEEFTGQWGTYLSGMYQTAMMTISTGVQAVAECKYDRIDEAMRYVNLIASTFNQRLPGSISEMSPDYGCFVQAWTSYGLVWPLLSHVFGIQPKAHWKEITIRPRLPKSWDHISLTNLEIGTGDKANVCCVSILKTKDNDKYNISLEKEGWKIMIDLPDQRYKKVLLDGQEVTPIRKENGIIILIENASNHEIQALYE